MVSRAKEKGKRYRGNVPLPFVYRPSHRYGVPGYLAYDDEGNEIETVIPEIRRLALGAATGIRTLESS